MSIATQIERLQGVRDQIRTKMVSLGLSENTDLLQNLADDLDGVNKVSPTNNGTTDPGSSYTNVDTLSRSTSTRYIKVPKGYNDADRKFTVSGVANGSVSTATTTDPGTSYTNQTTVTPSGTSAQYVKITAGYLPNSKITVSKMAAGSVASASTTDPGTDYANKTTVTPSTSAQYVKVTAGYLPNSKITVEAIPNQKGKDDVTATVTADVCNITSINASQVTDGVTVTASASGSTVVPVGYYSTQVSKTPSDSKSTTIKPKLAGTNGAIELTAGTSAFTKTSTADYSNGFITSVKVNPTPSQSKSITPTMAGQTVSPDPDSGKLLSSVTVNAVPSFSVAFTSASWSSDGNLTLGQYYATVNSDYITASNNLYVIPRSASDITAAQSFGIYAYSQSNGSMQFRAVAKPTSTVTYAVYYLN